LFQITADTKVAAWAENASQKSAQTAFIKVKLYDTDAGEGLSNCQFTAEAQRKWGLDHGEAAEAAAPGCPETGLGSFRRAGSHGLEAAGNGPVLRKFLASVVDGNGL
jgi:hypothetical protein